jgi:hypothetical protein
LKLRIAFAALALSCLAGISAHADLILTLTDPNVTVAPNETYTLQGYIQNTDPVNPLQVGNDTLSGPFSPSLGPTTAPAYNDLFQNYLFYNGWYTVAPNSTSPLINFVQITAGPVGVDTTGFYGVSDINYIYNPSYQIYTNVSPDVGTPEFSTVAMMILGSGGTLLQMVRRRARKAA